MAKYPDITNLKHGKTYPDPIATAKAQGTGFSDSCKHVKIPPAPANNLKGADGHLGDAIADKGRRGWADINPAAKPNTTTGKGGSKSRD